MDQYWKVISRQRISCSWLMKNMGFLIMVLLKYTRNEMYWIGYIYRYFVITYELTSMQVYKIVKPKELKGCFCHIIQWIHLRLLSEYWKQKACLQMKKWNWNVSMKYSKEYEIKKYKGCPEIHQC